MNTFTIEASFYGYLTKDRDTVSFNEDMLLKAGEAIALGIWDYLHINDPEVASRCSPKRKSSRIRPVSHHSPSPLKPRPNLTVVPFVSSSSDSLPAIDNTTSRHQGHVTLLPSDSTEGQTTDIDPEHDSSDGDSSADDLLPADQKRLHAHIVAVMKECNSIQSPVKARPGRIRLSIDPKSSLEPFFSGASGKKQRAKSRGKAVIPKIYDTAVFLQRRASRSTSLRDQPVRSSVRDLSPGKSPVDKNRRMSSAREKPILQRQSSVTIDNRR